MHPTTSSGIGPLLLMTSAMYACCGMAEGAEAIVETTVFARGEGEYFTYRIPAVVRTSKGVLLAFCEGRKTGGGDAGDIDLLVSRSTDQGESWSAPKVVWDDGPNTCGNPTPVIDAVSGAVWLGATWNLGTDHEDQILAGESEDVRHPYVLSSADDGLTWSAPSRISSTTRLPHWRWYAIGPGNGIQITRGPNAGLLVLPANHSDHSNENQHHYRSHVLYSADHGKSWELGGIHEDRTNESAVVERADGSLLQLMRSYHGENARAVASSTDGGKRWGPLSLEKDLFTPVCQASVLRFSWPGNSHDGLSRIVFASPHGPERRNMSLWVSFDEGVSWPVRKLIYPGPAAYSCLVKLSDDRLGLLYEKDDYDSINFATIQIDSLREE